MKNNNKKSIKKLNKYVGIKRALFIKSKKGGEDKLKNCRIVVCCVAPIFIRFMSMSSVFVLSFRIVDFCSQHFYSRTKN